MLSGVWPEALSLWCAEGFFLFNSFDKFASFFWLLSFFGLFLGDFRCHSFRTSCSFHLAGQLSRVTHPAGRPAHPGLIFFLF